MFFYSLPIPLVMIEIIYILCLIIIIKSEVWTITHCLGLGHEAMVSAVCLSIFLEIERGRYITPKAPVCDRRCRTCDVTDDEMHFLLNCVEYGNMQDDFYAKVENRCVGFSSLNDNEKYSFLMTNMDPYILVWLGKFVYQIFIKRNEMIQKFIE